MHYLDALKLCAQYGHGVFFSSLCGSRKHQDSFKFFKLRHPSFFETWIPQGAQYRLITLSKDCYKYLGVQYRTYALENYFSVLDAAIINAYMFEQNDFFEWAYKPRLILNTKLGNVGLLSTRYGPPKDLSHIDLLIGIKQDKLRYPNLNIHTPAPLNFFKNPYPKFDSII